jgi:hypothetical protein
MRDQRACAIVGSPSCRAGGQRPKKILRMLGLHQGRHAGFTVEHFHKQLRKRQHYKLG